MDSQLKQFEIEVVDLSELKGGKFNDFTTQATGCVLFNGKCTGDSSGCGVTNGNCDDVKKIEIE